MTTVVRYSLACAMAFGLAWGELARTFAGDATDDAEGAAARVVTALHESLIDIMQRGGALGYQGRYDAIASAIDATHDLDTIARLVVGRHWRALTETQHDDFVRTFRDLSISTYAARFKAYGGERFVIDSEQPLPRGTRRLVTSHFIKDDGTPIAFHYTMHRVRDQWKILNISVNGVSDVALKRAEYGGILKQDGFPELLQRLQKQIQDHTRGL